MRRSHRDSLILRGVVAVAALALATYARACIGLRLETLLNLGWSALALGAGTDWCLRSRSQRARLTQLLSLTFVLALLFPVISANDDVLLLADDTSTSQSAVISLEKDKRSTGLALAATVPTLVAAQLSHFLFCILASVPEFLAPLGPSAGVHATGNHSPPAL